MLDVPGRNHVAEAARQITSIHRSYDKTCATRASS